MGRISEGEFERICRGLAEDRESIIRHNPVGNENETLLWMLLSCLNSYLSLTEQEAPCFTSRPTEATYREAVSYVLRGRMVNTFDPRPYIDKLLET